MKLRPSETCPIFNVFMYVIGYSGQIMGQNVSTVQEYTPDNKPAKMENSHSLEKPRNENEENELNEKSEKAEKEKQKKLGINVMKKHSKMPMKMESFIIDTIIVEKLKYSGQ